MPEPPIEELEDRIGEQKRTVEDLTVEAGKVAEFARATKTSNPIYFDEDAAVEAGYDAIPAPPTFLRITMFPRYSPGGTEDDGGFDFGFDEGRTVHGEQQYTYERPLLVGDTLSGTTELADVSQKSGGSGTMTFAVLETEYTDEAGEVVATERKTIIETPAPEGGEEDDG
jgi:peroxisomal enoyl-CoA hydratase 2